MNAPTANAAAESDINVIPSLNFAQILSAAKSFGRKQTLLIRGTPGIGKSALVYAIAKELETHIPLVIDAAALDLGELMMPIVDQTNRVTYTAPNARFGVHLDKPVVLLIDELGKANSLAMNALLPLIYERRLGDRRMHEDSIIIAATNLDSDGVGDRIPSHLYSRVTEVRMLSPTAEQWTAWAMKNGLPGALMAFVAAYPKVLETYDQVPDMTNTYIFNPRRQNIRSYCCPRSLAATAPIIEAYTSGRLTDENLLRALIAGTIGITGMADMVSFLQMGSKLPSVQDVLKNPKAAAAEVLTSFQGSYMVTANLAVEIRTQPDMVKALAFFEALGSEECRYLFGHLSALNQASADARRHPEFRKLVGEVVAIM